MTHRWHLGRWLLPILGLLALTLLLAACNDDEEPDADGDATAADTAADGASGDDHDATALRSPTELDSYRFRMTMEAATDGEEDGAFALNLSVESEGAFVAPDRSSSTTVMDLGLIMLTVETVQIGEETWTRTDNGPWQQSGMDGALDGLGDLDVEISPALFFGEEGETAEESVRALSERLETVGGTPEAVNGIAATRYELTATEFSEIFGIEDELANAEGDGTTTIWIADDSRFPVRMELVSTTEQDGQSSTVTIVLEFFDLNDAAIAIEPPA